MNNIGEVIKQQRVTRKLTRKALGEMSGVSSSYLGRVEQGTRFPSARVLHKIAKPLGFSEAELLSLAGYLSRSTEPRSSGQIDPGVAWVLSKELAKIEAAITTITDVLKKLG